MADGKAQPRDGGLPSSSSGELNVDDSIVNDMDPAALVPVTNYMPWPAGNGTGGEHLASADSGAVDYAQLLAVAVAQANLKRTSMDIRLPQSERMQKMELDAKLLEPLSEADFHTVTVSRLHHPTQKAERRMLVDAAFATSDQDNLHLLTRFRGRMDRVGMEQPRVEVRFQNLKVEASVNVGQRGMPTVFNAGRDIVEGVLTAAHLMRTDRRPFTILQGVSGVLKPGRLTLLLGPPGSGKSTLLKVLAGVVRDGSASAGSLKLGGEVRYNGETFDSFQVRRTAAYVDQVDNLLAELTVRETLDFAAACQGSGYAAELVAELRTREKAAGIVPEAEVDAILKAYAIEGRKHNVASDIFMRILGLDICAETPIGNNLMRGVSGGQKKRVTTGELIVGPHKTLFMDEISTGLDSSTTFLICKCMRNFVHIMEGTVLMALLQPPPEVFELFDDVMLLSEGHIVYHGPREQVTTFFSSLGFEVPERKGTCDFLQEVTSCKDQGQYWTGAGPHVFKPVLELCAAFEQFSVGRAMSAHLEQPFEVSKKQLIDPLVRTKYALTGYQAFQVCLWRDITLMKRYTFLYAFKTFQTLILAFVMSTLFVKPRNHPGSTVANGVLFLAIIFFSLIHLMFSGYAEMALLCSQLPVFYKQRDMQFFPAWCFALPTVFLRFFWSISDAIIWSCMVYWSTGLAPEATRFFIYFAYMVAIHQMALSLFRFMAALGRTFAMANSFGSMALIITILLGGFVLTKKDIHPWWIWFFWISPLMYPTQALCINEMTAPRWNVPTDLNGVTMPLGQAILTSRSLFHEHYWIWVSILVVIGYCILFNIGIFWCLGHLSAYEGNQATMSEEALEAREFNRTGIQAAIAKPKRASIDRGGRGRNAGPPAAIAMSAIGGAGGTAAAAPAARVARTSMDGDVAIDLEAAVSAGGKGMLLPFQPMAMAFRNICYQVDMPDGADGFTEAKAAGEATPQLVLLHSITGTFRPGVLTALVGVSGAGKTTLMDVLAGRKTSGVITGDMHVGGFVKDQATFSRVCGYVEQSDIHSPRTTVREALQFSGLLRLYGVHRRDVEVFVDEVLQLVELESLRDALVGMPGVFGLSVEQRKRLTIAVELVANPSVIFMDEPTSGLDARAAAIVMRAVRNTVNTGRTVVCTIHQPSIDIFEAFDDLLLLRRGGRVIYNGPIGTRSDLLINYFSGIKGVPPIRDGINPATWALEITSMGAEAKTGLSFADLYRASDLCVRNAALVDSLSVPAEGTAPLHFDREFARGFGTQLLELQRRDLRQYWRDPGYNAVRFAFSTVLGLMLGSVYWGLGQKYGSPTDVFNIMGALFICITFLGTSNASGVQPVVSTQRPIFYRERATFMYGVVPYTISQGLTELPFILAQTLLYGSITYWMIGFAPEPAKFFWYLLFTYLTLVFFAFYGMMSIAITPLAELAGIMSALIYTFWFLLAGFLITYPQMPGWWSWYYWLDPLAYALYGIISSQLGDVQAMVNLESGVFQTVSEFLVSSLGFHHNFIGWCVLIMIAYICFFWLVVGVALKFVNFNKR